MAEHDRAEARRWFATSRFSAALADQLLPEGRPWGHEAAVEALAAFAVDDERLRAHLRTVPGAALAALAVLARSTQRSPREPDLVRACDHLLGEGRGAAAVEAVLASGVADADACPGFASGFFLHHPFAPALKRIFAGLHRRPAPPVALLPAPDRSGFPAAVLLGLVASRPIEVSARGVLQRGDARALDAAFGRALGRGVAAALLKGLTGTGAVREEYRWGASRARHRLAVDVGAAERLLASTHAERAVALAESLRRPQWLAELVTAGEAFVDRAVLEAADGLWAEARERETGWLAVARAAGLVEEWDGAVRLAPVLRGAPGAVRPARGRWQVGRDLGVRVPADAPALEVFHLARFCEVASFGPAALLRLSPASLARAVEHGADPATLLPLLASGAAAPLPDDVRAAVERLLGDARPLDRIAPAWQPCRDDRRLERPIADRLAEWTRKATADAIEPGGPDDALLQKLERARRGDAAEFPRGLVTALTVAEPRVPRSDDELAALLEASLAAVERRRRAGGRGAAPTPLR